MSDPRTTSKSGAWLRVSLCASICVACENRIEDCYTPGPWRPAHEGDPCHAPPEALGNSLDSFAGVLHCGDGVWWDFGVNEGWIVLEGDVEQGFCSTSCLADMQPETTALDIVCAPTAVLYDTPDQRNNLTLSACEPNGNGWSVPEGEDACFAIAIGLAGAFDALPSACRERGTNTAFVVVGDTVAIGGEFTEIGVQCQFQHYRDGTCSGAELPENGCSD